MTGRVAATTAPAADTPSSTGGAATTPGQPRPTAGAPCAAQSIPIEDRQSRRYWSRWSLVAPPPQAPPRWAAPPPWPAQAGPGRPTEAQAAPVCRRRKTAGKAVCSTTSGHSLLCGCQNALAADTTGSDNREASCSLQTSPAAQGVPTAEVCTSSYRRGLAKTPASPICRSKHRRAPKVRLHCPAPPGMEHGDFTALPQRPQRQRRSSKRPKVDDGEPTPTEPSATASGSAAATAAAASESHAGLGSGQQHQHQHSGEMLQRQHDAHQILEQQQQQREQGEGASGADATPPAAQLDLPAYRSAAVGDYKFECERWLWLGLQGPGDSGAALCEGCMACAACVGSLGKRARPAARISFLQLCLLALSLQTWTTPPTCNCMHVSAPEAACALWRLMHWLCRQRGVVAPPPCRLPPIHAMV